VSIASRPRILLLDFETFPNLAYVWGAWEQNVIEMKEDWYILSYAARWHGTRPIVCRGIDDTGDQKSGKTNSDGRLMKEIHALMDEADIIVAHNGVDFDVKVANTRLIVHGFTPPSPYKVVDTKRAIKQVARFSSNKLDWLCKQLGLGRKMEHEGFPLWLGCAAGDPAAWRKMKRYNRHDVRLLGDLYTLIAPWIRQPNAALYYDGERCVNPACGSDDIYVNPRLYYASTRAYRRFQCRKCGKWARATVSERRPRATVVGAA
jgi:hypothetical protein